MPSSLDPGIVGRIPLQNRILRSATFEFTDDVHGRYTPFYHKLYGDLANGGIGAIITGMVAVDADSQLNAGMVKAYTDEFEAEFRSLKNQAGCPIIVQISHCGVKASVISDGGSPFGPSEMDLPSGLRSRAMDRDHIARVVASFASTAARCKRAGADGVQLHGAHGYCLSQFLSPFYNKRDDEYGGDIAGRSRIVMEVYDAVRAEVGADYPVWIKINNQDYLDPGLSLEEAIQVCIELDTRGIDAIEVSGGGNATPASRAARPVKSAADEGFFAADARAIAEKVGTSVISVGGHRTVDGMDAWLDQGGVAAVSLSRPLIAEPALVNTWRSDRTYRPRCISCNKCYLSKDGVTCQVFGVDTTSK